MNSCNLNKNKVLNQDIKTEKKSELVHLEIRLPFESSNNWKGNDVNFKLTDNHGKIVESEFDTVTKTGGHIEYTLKKDIYSYSIKTPFNETIKKKIAIKRDTSFYFYKSCYEKVSELSENDIENTQKINIHVTYEFKEPKIDEIQIERKDSNYVLKIKKNGNWTDKIVKDRTQIINAIKEYKDKIIDLNENEVFGTEELSYITASQVFIKYDNKLLEISNIKNDSLYQATKELKQNLNKIL